MFPPYLQTYVVHGGEQFLLAQEERRILRVGTIFLNLNMNGLEMTIDLLAR